MNTKGSARTRILLSRWVTRCRNEKIVCLFVCLLGRTHLKAHEPIKHRDIPWRGQLIIFSIFAENQNNKFHVRKLRTTEKKKRMKTEWIKQQSYPLNKMRRCRKFSQHRNFGAQQCKSMKACNGFPDVCVLPRRCLAVCYKCFFPLPWELYYRVTLTLNPFTSRARAIIRAFGFFNDSHRGKKAEKTLQKRADEFLTKEKTLLS